MLEASERYRITKLQLLLAKCSSDGPRQLQRDLPKEVFDWCRSLHECIDQSRSAVGECGYLWAGAVQRIYYCLAERQISLISQLVYCVGLTLGQFLANRESNPEIRHLMREEMRHLFTRITCYRILSNDDAVSQVDLICSLIESTFDSDFTCDLPVEMLWQLNGPFDSAERANLSCSVANYFLDSKTDLRFLERSENLWHSKIIEAIDTLAATEKYVRFALSLSDDVPFRDQLFESIDELWYRAIARGITD